MRLQMASDHSRRTGRHRLLGGKGHGRAVERTLVALSLVVLLASAWSVDGRPTQGCGLLPVSLPPASFGGGNVSCPGEVPQADDWLGEGVSFSGDMTAGGDGTRSWESERPLTEEAQTILVGYRQRKDCVLVRAGYVDLVGQAWSCVIQGDGWVDICVVRETDVGSSKVSVSRIENSMWEESLNAEGAYG